MEFYEIEHDTSARIKVIGVGGGGGNAVNNMIQSALKGVEFIAANTDAQDLHKSLAEHKIFLGDQLTKGLGAGANPEVGRNAAQESIDQIREAISGADMVFITAGMGGGTGTGAAPIIAQAAKEADALTVAVVTKPFFFEGKRRLEAAEHGIQELRDVVDSIITIPNDRLLQMAAKKAAFAEMLKKADEVLYYATKGIADLITVQGLINLDFADVKAVMSGSGMALMGTGIASGEGRAAEAAKRAISSPLLEDVSIHGAKGVLMNITCAPDMLIDEVSEAAAAISREADENANIFFGTVFDPNIGDEMRITVIATGIEDVERAKAESEKQRKNLSLVNPVGTIKGGRRVQGSVFRETNRNIPAYLRYGKGEEGAAEQPSQPAPQRTASRRVAAGPGEEEFVFEEDELDVPAFIRRKAD
ncbi:MAG: cell division protein FtsZ [Desulfovibrionaceae bacterium]